MEQAEAHVLALDAVSFLVGFGGGEVVSLGLPPQSTGHCPAWAPATPAPCPLGSCEHPCLRPLHRNSHQSFAFLEALARVLSLSRGASPLHIPELAILPGAAGGACCPSPSLDVCPQTAGFAGQPRVPPRPAGTRSTWSCSRCAPCCPSPRGRRSGSPTSTPWPWCASSCGGPSCSPQVPMALLYPRRAWLCTGTAPASSQRFTLRSPCRLGSSRGTSPRHRAALPAAGLSARALSQRQAGLHLGERGPGPGPLHGKAMRSLSPCPSRCLCCVRGTLPWQLPACGSSGVGTVGSGSSLFVRWSCSPRGTQSLTSSMGERMRMCGRSSSSPRSSPAGVREASAGISCGHAQRARAGPAGSGEREPLTRSGRFVSPQRSRLSARCAPPRPSGCSMGGTGPWQCAGASRPCAGRPPPPPSWPSARQSHSCPRTATPVPRTTCSRARTSWTCGSLT